MKNKFIGKMYSDTLVARSGFPWLNWYISRGRIQRGYQFRRSPQEADPYRKDLRALSWRRVI